MKYLVENSQTRKLLGQWAGHSELVIAHHYFWHPGTAMQKSQLGLLRTLLFHIVQQAPEAALELVHERFKNCSAGGIPAWTPKELSDLIEAVGRKTELGVRLCFFIDGLDEYIGEHVDLVQLLLTLAECPCIKICVSSRPWNVFTRAYDRRADGQLAMQDLTGSHVRAYIEDKMSADPLFREYQQYNPDGCHKLQEDIRAKAQGVFLWVFLIVRSLLRGLGSDDDPETLQRRLDEYPENLDGYFQRMFDRVENVHRRHSARIVLTALAQGELSPWAPRCIEIEIGSPEHALLLPLTNRGGNTGNPIIRCECHCQDGKRLSEKCLHYLADYGRYTTQDKAELKRYLDARCADLIELMPSGAVEFIHRTARDFLAQCPLQATLHERAGLDFDAGLCLARISLADIKTMCQNGRFSPGLVDRLVRMRASVKPKNLVAYEELITQLLENASVWSLVGHIKYNHDLQRSCHTLVD